MQKDVETNDYFTRPSSSAAAVEIPNELNLTSNMYNFPTSINQQHQQQYHQLYAEDQLHLHNSSRHKQQNSELKYLNSENISLLEKQMLSDEFGDTDEELSLRRYLGFGIQWISLVTENLLSHPFIVLRRQCQVNNAAKRYHLHPFTLIPSIIHLHRRQGVTTLWKGLGSCLLVRGLSLAVDDALSKLTTWPKEVDNRTTLKNFGQHILLKCISIAIVVPFCSASLVETVQSDIASEKPGIFDVFREGSLRLIYWSSPQKGRMLPVWALVGPCISLGITKYFFSLVIKGVSARIIRYRLQRKSLDNNKCVSNIKGNDFLENQDIEIYSKLISILTSEVIFYPFETIIHRLQLQGTRTIIDNLDSGASVLPILTNYQGAIDCYRLTISTEGFFGFYKGFGAIILQFVAHIAVIKLTKWVVNQMTEVFLNRPPAKIVEYYNLERETLSNPTTISSNLSSKSGGLDG